MYPWESLQFFHIYLTFRPVLPKPLCGTNTASAAYSGRSSDCLRSPPGWGDICLFVLSKPQQQLWTCFGHVPAQFLAQVCFAPWRWTRPGKELEFGSPSFLGLFCPSSCPLSPSVTSSPCHIQPPLHIYPTPCTGLPFALVILGPTSP